jgi:chromate reductase, NAD(P)H dehydrogenase (quinone)
MMKSLLLLLAIACVPLTIFAELKVLAFAGSTRTDSYNKKLVREAAEKAQAMGAKVTVIDLRDFPMPLYDADLEIKDGMPVNAKKLRQIILEHDAMIIASPEYNASMPAILKNAIDWTSRTEDGKSSNAAYKGKKFAIMSATPSRRGGVHALSHLRLVLEDLGAIVVPSQIEISRVFESTPEKEKRKNDILKQELQELLSNRSVKLM